jgi:hypothetical protein
MQKKKCNGKALVKTSALGIVRDNFCHVREKRPSWEVEMRRIKSAVSVHTHRRWINRPVNGVLALIVLFGLATSFDQAQTEPGNSSGGASAMPMPAAATQPATEPSAELPESKPGTAGPTTVPEVVVVGRGQDLVGVANSSNQGFIGPEDIQDRPLLRPAEVLEEIPGLVITQHSGPGKANQYFLRGFQLDHGTDFSVSLEGVPQNLPTHAHGQGYLDLNDLIPELVQSIDYRKGPYFGDVGDFSAAGSADIRYVDTLPQGIASVTGGSYGFERALVADSAPLGKGNFLWGFEGEHENGPWDVPDNYDKFNGLLKYSEGAEKQGWSITSFGMSGKWDATNQVAERAVDDGMIDRFGSLNPTDGGDSERYTVVGEVHQKDTNGESKLEGYGAWYDMQLWNDFTYYLNNPTMGDQFEQEDRRFYGGVQGSHTFFGSVSGRTSDTTVGVQLRSDAIFDGLYDTEDRERYATVEAAHTIESSGGLYVENQTQWADKFRTEGSLRDDYFNFHVRSDIQPNSGDVNSDIFSPKLNLIFGPWDKTEFYISGGYGFHSNDARGITSELSPGTLLPAEHVTPLTQAKGAEVGVRTGIVPGLQSTVSLFGLDLKSEEVYDGDTAETVPSGPSRRIGVEFGNNYNLTPWLTLDGDYSISSAHFADHEAAGSYVPESIGQVLQAGIAFHDYPYIKGLFGGVHVRYFGPRALTQDDSVRSNSSTILDADLGYKFSDKVTLRADFLNFMDTKTDDIEYYYTSRLPGEPAGGVAGIVGHPAEPFEARLTLEIRF